MPHSPAKGIGFHASGASVIPFASQMDLIFDSRRCWKSLNIGGIISNPSPSLPHLRRTSGENAGGAGGGWAGNKSGSLSTPAYLRLRTYFFASVFFAAVFFFFSTATGVGALAALLAAFIRRDLRRAYWTGKRPRHNAVGGRDVVGGAEIPS
mgnify:CR=1 FL=1